MTFRSMLMAAAAVVGLSSAVAGSAIAGNNPYQGQIQAVGMNWCPQNWVKLDGQLLSIAGNSSLFSLLGTHFGGDGYTNFALPDLRGRSPVGASLASPPPPPLPALGIGDKGGHQRGQIIMPNLPPHTHQIIATQSDPAVSSPSGAAIPTIPDATRLSYTHAAPGSAQMFDGVVGVSGRSTTFPLYQPSLSITYCIATSGRYPPRN